jgi:hypothetical protein
MRAAVPPLPLSLEEGWIIPPLLAFFQVLGGEFGDYPLNGETG